MATKESSAIKMVNGEKLTYDVAKNLLSDGRAAVIMGAARVNGTPSIPPFTSSEALELAVDDGAGELSILYTCRDGDFVSENALSVHTHAAHHGRTYQTGPMYDVETIKMVLRTVKQCRIDGIKAPEDAAAAKLNTFGLKTHHGKDWTRSAVRHIVDAYSDRYRVHVRRPKNDADPSKIEIDVTPVSSPPATSAETAAETHEIKTHISEEDLQEHARKMLNGVTVLRAWINEYIAMTCDDRTVPEGFTLIADTDLDDLRVKAARWDQFFALTREIKS